MSTTLVKEIAPVSRQCQPTSDGQKEATEKSHALPSSFNQLASRAENQSWPRKLLQPHCDVPYDGPSPPDGGMRAWAQVFAGHLVLISTWGYVNCFGWFQAYYVTEFDRPASDVSWIVSMEIFMLTLLATVSGRLFDAGYYRHLLVAGFLTQLLGIFTTSVATKYWQAFLAQGLCGGIACACLWTPHVSLMSTWFLKKRSFAIALMLCGTSTGGVIWTVIAQQVAPVIGFSWTVRVMGFIVLGLFLVVLALTRTRVPPRTGGPLLDLPAFKETPYALFTVGAVLILWGVYPPFFYVSITRCSR